MPGGEREVTEPFSTLLLYNFLMLQEKTNKQKGNTDSFPEITIEEIEIQQTIPLTLDEKPNSGYEALTSSFPCTKHTDVTALLELTKTVM